MQRESEPLRDHFGHPTRRLWLHGRCHMHSAHVVYVLATGEIVGQCASCGKETFHLQLAPGEVERVNGL